MTHESHAIHDEITTTADAIANINIFISDTDVDKLHTSSIKHAVKRIMGIRSFMTKREFEFQAKNLYKCCLKGVRDMHELHERRIIGMAIIDDMILRVDPNYITVRHVIHLIWSIMSCIHHFQLRLRTGTGGIVHYTRRRRTEQCMESYSKLIRLFKPVMHRIILNSIITFYKEGKLWEIEFACTDLIMRLLNVYEDVEEGVNDILNAAEKASVTNMTEAKHMIQVLYELLRKVKWRSMSVTLMSRLLSMLKCSIFPKETDSFNYVPLRMGLELCIRNAISNLQNRDLLNMLCATVEIMSEIEECEEDTLLNFGSIAAYAAHRYRVKTFYHKIRPEILQRIFGLILTRKPMAIFVSSRIWLNLIDRNNNAAKIRSPRIYFPDCDYQIKIKKCKNEDKLFFKDFRHRMYRLALNSFRDSHKTGEMETVYQSCALMLVEIPCGYSASTITSIAMSLQEYAFNISNDDLVKSHHLHAIVLSLLSLVCYVHKAEVFYAYVNTIMERRSEWAPHLNPPLKTAYQYAQHHILWNKPDLFFEDWEARYGLWKCFRLKKKGRK